ncbi:hypothetical protein EMIT053CA3_60018 [Pseudomonas donghuensis]
MRVIQAMPASTWLSSDAGGVMGGLELLGVGREAILNECSTSEKSATNLNVKT